MKELTLENFIKDYAKITEINKESIDDLTKEIKNVVDMTPQFQNQNISDEDIKKILKSSSENLEESSNKLLKIFNKEGALLPRIEQNTKDTINDASSYIKKEADSILGDIPTSINDASSYVKTETNNILGDTKDVIEPISIFGKLLFNTAKTLLPSLSIFNSNKKSKESEMPLDDIKNDIKDNFQNQNTSFSENVDDLQSNITDNFDKQNEILSNNCECDVLQNIRTINADILDALYEYLGFQKNVELKREREIEIPKMGYMSKFGIAALLGFISGAIYRKIIIPLQLLYMGVLKLPVIGKAITKTLNLIKKAREIIFGGIKSLAEKLWSLAKIILNLAEKSEKFGEMTTKIKSTFPFIEKIFSFIGKFKKIIWMFASKFAMFSGMFKLGFKVFGWPLQILLSLIDFVKGWINSVETTFIGKLKDGLKNVMFKFLEFPVYLLGQLWKKIFKTDFGGEEFVQNLKIYINVLFDAVFRPFEIIWEIVKWVWDVAKKTFTSIKRFFEDIYDAIGDFYDTYLKSIVDFYMKWNPISIIFNAVKWVYTQISDFFGSITTDISKEIENISFLKKIKDIFVPIVDFFVSVGSFVKKIMKWVGDKLSNIPIIGGLWTSDETKNTKDKEEINNIKKEISELNKDRLFLIEEQKKRSLNRKEKRRLKRANKDIERKKEDVNDLNENIEKRKIGIAKENINKIFKSGIGVDDWGANKIVQPEKLKQFSTDQLKDILKAGNWEDNSIKMIENAIKKSLTSPSNKEINELPIKNEISPIISKAKDAVSKAKDISNNAVSKAKDISDNVVSKVKDISAPAISKVKDISAPAISKVKDISAPAISKVKDISSKAKSFINDNKYIKDLKRHEGYKEGLYRDSLGYWTGGYGTLISKDKSLSKADALDKIREKGFNPNASKRQKEKFWGSKLTEDALKSKSFVMNQADKKGINLNQEQLDILSNMTYNLGEGGIMNFKNMWSALEKGDIKTASTEMKDSKWYNQVGNRSRELVSRMQNSDISKEIDNVQIAKTNAKKKEIQTQQESSKTISKAMKDINENVAKPTPIMINNNNEENLASIDPPEDVESMSILWLNKSWGLG